ncbi:helix-turn-helix domain-containing protein [Myroides sp. LoEW2-1]|uniref:AraC family transcriptional regulator n=2 Tax=Myroides TaxID=76831 RepID=UPI001324FF74|nr:helix-turn-helix domain-containing protein [Myroides sp. LoEW2-1]MVX37116.1 helix-turn-helix domain-containing protein [Myroides sp. LoEW2-1]
MYYHEIAPILPLRPYVQYFWVLEDTMESTEVRNFKIIPDGVPALIFQDSPNLFTDVQGKLIPKLYVYGQFNQYTEERISGAFRIIGVYLYPTALKALFGIDANEFANQNIPLEELVHQPILEKVVNARTVREKIVIISQFLVQQLQNQKGNADKANYVSNLLQYGKSLKQVQQEMNISERTLERLVKQYVGMSPKVYSRIIRFQANLNLLRESSFKSLTELTYESGYFDQSHYIREFKTFTGSTPKQYLLDTQEQLLNFPEFKK